MLVGGTNNWVTRLNERFQQLSAGARWRVGWLLSNALSPPLDLRSVTDDPIEVAYISGGRTFLIDVDLRDCRGLGPTAFPCDSESRHPFIETLRAYRHGTCTDYFKSPLRKYYERWQPQNVAERLGMCSGETNPSLLIAPPIGCVMPWDPLDPKTMEARRLAVLQSENSEHRVNLQKADGCAGFGPVSGTRGEFEFRRLTRLYHVIGSHGYRPSRYLPNGDIVGVLLSWRGVSRIIVSGGQHRIAVLAALGHERTRIRLYGHSVSPQEVHSWPNVRNGLLTSGQAQAIFQRIFDGGQPPGYQ